MTRWRLLAATAAVAMSGHGLGAGEQPLNSIIYKSSHNSYDRDQSLAAQIDDYNVWQIELDICDSNKTLMVSHTCDPATLASASTLQFLLQKMMNESVTFRSRFTIIYLDLKDSSWASDFAQRLSDTFTTILRTASIYPSSEFIQSDKSAWPSHQELVRRGFNASIIVDWHTAAPAGGNPDKIFFTVAQSNPLNPAQEASDAVLVNNDGGCNVSPTSQVPSLVNARWLYRCYPGACGQTCDLLDGAYWQNGISKQYNLIATNCIDSANTFDPATQSPDPLYVAMQASTNCPHGYPSCEWGTVTFPYRDLGKASQRASNAATLLIQPGVYSVAHPTPLIVDHPLILKLNGAGAALLQ